MLLFIKQVAKIHDNGAAAKNQHGNAKLLASWRFAHQRTSGRIEAVIHSKLKDVPLAESESACA
jgi:hypothetical protein